MTSLPAHTASLRTRLLLSFGVVAGTGAVAFYVAARFLVPRFFDQRMGAMNGAGTGMGGTGGMSTGQHGALVSAVNTSMLIALGATIICSAFVAVVMSRRTLRSIEVLRDGAGALAAGDYSTRVERPGEAELADLADDINRLAAALADTEQRRAALIGDVAHEMRTPLTTIGGTLEGFGDGLFSTEELTTTVRSELGRLQHLAADLASVSRAEEGQLALDLRPGDLRETMVTVVERLRPRFTDAGVTLTLHDGPAIRATFDRERVVQVLTNLLTNALAYTPSGGSVDVRTTVSPVDVGITVTDTGRGLSADDVRRVFERFYRVDRTDHSEGTGIGLTISRAIARAHGGDLVATSPGPGRGTTFELRLPPEPTSHVPVSEGPTRS